MAVGRFLVFPYFLRYWRYSPASTVVGREHIRSTLGSIEALESFCQPAGAFRSEQSAKRANERASNSMGR
jgi:hypothetical protein